MPTGIELGPFTLRFYGMIIMLGVLAAAGLSYYRAKLRRLDTEFIWDGLIWALIGGIVGARLWHVFTPTPSDIARGLTTEYYLTHPLQILKTWDGGLGIPGAVIGGALAIYILTRRKKTSFAVWADVVAPGLALAQAIGRWGNFINQELYGRPTDVPWAIEIDPQHRFPEFMQYSHYHPLFLYESLWNLMNMAVLLWLDRRWGEKLKPGDLFLVYLVIYPIGRFLLEFLRLNSAEIGGINANQAFMAIVALASAGFLIWRHWKAAKSS